MTFFKNIRSSLKQTLYYSIGWIIWSYKGVIINNGSKISPFADISAGCIISGCVIAKDVKIDQGTYISTGIIKSAKIGKYVSIGPEVLIGLTEHRVDYWTLSPIEAKLQGEIDSPTDKEKKIVIIQDGCWIGARSILLQGITIGAGSVVAAGAVVTKSIPPMEVWGGTPAKKIKNRHISRNDQC